MDSTDTHTGFQTTSWTLIGAIQSDSEDDRSRAREALAARYWPAVYGHLRRCGRGPDEAADLTQGFFTDVVLWRGLFEAANASRGRLRSLMLSALRNYQRDQARRECTRGGGRLIPLEAFEAEESRHTAESNGSDQNVLSSEVESAFARRWAVSLLEETMIRTEAHFRANGKIGHWAAFEARILRPAVSGVEPRPLFDVARECGFKGAADAAAAVQVVKKRSLLLLRELAAESSESDCDEELQMLEQIFGRDHGQC